MTTGPILPCPRGSGNRLARRLLAIPVIAGMAVSGCGGSSADVPATAAPTIVSVNPCTDAILHEIAAPGQLLAISHYSHDPSATSMVLDDALGYPAIGGTAEEVLAYNPDIVVAGIFMPLATKLALEEAGVEVVEIDIAVSLENSLSQIAELGEVTGETQRAAELADTISARWDAAAVDDPPITALLWQAGGIVAGEDSLAFRLLDHTGFASHSAARGMGQGEYLPLEEVLADPPDLILAAGNERMLSHPVLGDLENVAYDTFEMSLLYCGGPTIPRALDRLAAIRARILPIVPAGG